MTADRLTGHVIGTDISLDEPNVVTLVSEKGADLIADIGSSAERDGAMLAPGLSIDAFDPRIAAGVVGFLGLRMWDRLHPVWRGPLGLLDQVDIRVSIDRFAELPRARRRAFCKALPNKPHLTWWVEGVKVQD